MPGFRMIGIVDLDFVYEGDARLVGRLRDRVVASRYDPSAYQYDHLGYWLINRTSQKHENRLNENEFHQYLRFMEDEIARRCLRLQTIWSNKHTGRSSLNGAGSVNPGDFVVLVEEREREMERRIDNDRNQ